MNMYENGIDYIEKAVKSYHQKDFKVTCLFLWSGLLLLLKQKLYNIHPSMILEKIEMEINNQKKLVLPELNKNGNFKSLDYKGIQTRYKKLKCNYKLLAKYQKSFEKLRKIRNRIEHFDYQINEDDILKIFHALMPFINDFIEIELKKSPHEEFHNYPDFLKIDDFYKSRLKTMKEYIANEEPTYKDIKHGKQPLEKMSCSNCPQGIMISKENIFYCEACGYEENLYECSRCGGKFPEQEWSESNKEIEICDYCWNAIMEKKIKLCAITNYVSKTGSHISPFSSLANAATNIQAAIDEAIDGSTVLVNDGTYYPDDQIIVNKDITIKSINGAVSTIVDGCYPTQTNRCFYLNNANTTIDGFTITNGFAYNYNNYFGNFGGGLLSYKGIIQNCVISGNLANDKGGGVYCTSGGIVQNCTISGNSANNKYDSGGGVYCYKSGIIRNCYINSNSTYYGGGISCWYNCAVQDCIINDNLSLCDGGGIFNYGGIMRNCVVNGNLAYGNGGGVFCRLGGAIQSCTIIANTATNSGGSVYCWEFSTIQNSILWNNTDSYFFSSDSTNLYNCIENWTNLVNGIITNNPEFRNAASGDYHLESYSPCINKGTNMNWMWSSTDLDGNPRIIDGIVDMGAYEYIPEPSFGIILSLFLIYMKKVKYFII